MPIVLHTRCQLARPPQAPYARTDGLDRLESGPSLPPEMRDLFGRLGLRPLGILAAAGALPRHARTPDALRPWLWEALLCQLTERQGAPLVDRFDDLRPLCQRDGSLSPLRDERFVRLLDVRLVPLLEAVQDFVDDRGDDGEARSTVDDPVMQLVEALGMRARALRRGLDGEGMRPIQCLPACRSFLQGLDGPLEMVRVREALDEIVLRLDRVTLARLASACPVEATEAAPSLPAATAPMPILARDLSPQKIYKSLGRWLSSDEDPDDAKTNRCLAELSSKANWRPLRHPRPQTASNRHHLSPGLIVLDLLLLQQQAGLGHATYEGRKSARQGLIAAMLTGLNQAITAYPDAADCARAALWRWLDEEDEEKPSHRGTLTHLYALMKRLQYADALLMRALGRRLHAWGVTLPLELAVALPMPQRTAGSGPLADLIRSPCQTRWEQAACYTWCSNKIDRGCQDEVLTWLRKAASAASVWADVSWPTQQVLPMSPMSSPHSPEAPRYCASDGTYFSAHLVHLLSLIRKQDYPLLLAVLDRLKDEPRHLPATTDAALRLLARYLRGKDDEAQDNPLPSLFRSLRPMLGCKNDKVRDGLWRALCGCGAQIDGLELLRVVEQHMSADNLNPAHVINILFECTKENPRATRKTFNKLRFEWAKRPETTAYVLAAQLALAACTRTALDRLERILSLPDEAAEVVSDSAALGFLVQQLGEYRLDPPMQDKVLGLQAGLLAAGIDAALRRGRYAQEFESIVKLFWQSATVPVLSRDPWRPSPRGLYASALTCALGGLRGARGAEQEMPPANRREAIWQNGIAKVERLSCLPSEARAVCITKAVLSILERAQGILRQDANAAIREQLSERMRDAKLCTDVLAFAAKYRQAADDDKTASLLAAHGEMILEVGRGYIDEFIDLVCDRQTLHSPG